jgi:hypothetical protein
LLSWDRSPGNALLGLLSWDCFFEIALQALLACEWLFSKAPGIALLELLSWDCSPGIAPLGCFLGIALLGLLSLID